MINHQNRHQISVNSHQYQELPFLLEDKALFYSILCIMEFELVTNH